MSLAVLRIWTTAAGTMATRNATVTAAMDSHQGRSQVTCTQSMERCRAPTSRLLSAASASTSSPVADARLSTASPVGWSSATGCRIAALPPVESKRTWRSAKGSDCRRGEQSSRTRRAGPCDTAAALPRARLLNSRGTPVAGSPLRATSAPMRCPKVPTARAARRIRRDAAPGLRARRHTRWRCKTCVLVLGLTAARFQLQRKVRPSGKAASHPGRVQGQGCRLLQHRCASPNTTQALNVRPGRSRLLAT